MLRDRPIRVHVLIDSLNWGGAEALLGEFATVAQESGIELSVSHLSQRPGAEDRLREAGIEPVLLDVHGLLGRRGRGRVRDHLRAVAPDLLHTHLGYSDFHGGLAARRLGIPALSTLHTMYRPDPGSDWVKEKLMAWARRRCTYRVIAVSDAVRRHYVDLGLDSDEHVVTVRNGIADRVRPGAGAEVRRELGIDPGAFLLCMVSVLRTDKGHDVAARALRALLPQHPNLKLLVLGDGPDRERIAAGFADLGEAVVMAGHRDDVLATLDASDALLHPSTIDALPTALMEAMAARVAIIATRVGGIPELIDDGENGLLIPAPPDEHSLAAAIERLADSPGLVRQLGASGRNRFEREFTAERWMERLLPLYHAAIADDPVPLTASVAQGRSSGEQVR